MEMADYWLEEKQLVHKLFKVLVPRYQNHDSSFTQMFLAPNKYPGKHSGSAVLELKGILLKISQQYHFFAKYSTLLFQAIPFLHYLLQPKIVPIGCQMCSLVKLGKSITQRRRKRIHLLNH